MDFPFRGVVSQRELDELAFVIWENRKLDIRVYQFFSNIRNSDDQWWFRHLYLHYINLNNSLTKCYTKVDGSYVKHFIIRYYSYINIDISLMGTGDVFIILSINFVTFTYHYIQSMVLSTADVADATLLHIQVKLLHHCIHRKKYNF